MKASLLIPLAMAACPALAQFKCTQADGSVAFQQMPCPAEAKSQRLELPASSTATNTSIVDSAEWKKEADARVKEAAEAVRRARAVRAAALEQHCGNKRVEQVTIGMPAADLFCVPGYQRPVTVNRTTTEAGESVQYIYQSGSRRKYVYTRGGRVSAIQD